MIGFCTDSGSQMPADLRHRFDVEIVALTVTINGVHYLEGVDLDADAFYETLARCAEPPEVLTAAPSPGRFAAAYERLAARGFDQIVSVHTGSNLSSTVNSARLGATGAPAPVAIADTQTGSFAVSCALREAAEAAGRGATVEEVVAIAEAVGKSCGNVFVVGGLELARAGGRLAAGTSSEPDATPVLSLIEDKIETIGSAASVAEGAEIMAAHVVAAGPGLRVGIGIADAAAEPYWLEFERRLSVAPEVDDILRYRVGPSVGAHTGTGCAGAVYYRPISA
ncbi:MAG: DegV family protein [Acidimicrobiales bacterium]